MQIQHFFLLIFRVEELWKEEIRKKGIEKASLAWVVVRFIRTRHIVAYMFGFTAISCSFISGVSFKTFTSTNRWFSLLLRSRSSLDFV